MITKHKWRTLGLIVGALVCGALMASVASAAEPEFAHVGTFTAESGTASFVSDGNYSCSRGIKIQGEITGARTVSAKLYLRECGGGTEFCLNKTEGTERVIESEPLTGTLGYVSRNPLEVGLELGKGKYEAGKHPVFAKFNCGISSVELKGFLIGVLTPINTKTKEFHFEYSQVERVQQYNHFITVPAGEQLSWYRGISEPVLFGLQAGGSLLTSVEQEIKAVPATPPAPKLVLTRGAFPHAFTTSGGKVSFASESPGPSMKCTGESGSGKFTGSNAAGELTLKLTGCEAFGFKCGNKGEVTTKVLKTGLFYTLPQKISTEGRESALVLSPASGEVVAEFSCSVIKMSIEGSLMAVVTPLNLTKEILSLSIKQISYHQTPNEYEVEGGGKSTVGLSCTEEKQPSYKCGEEVLSPSLTLTGASGLIEA